MDPPAKGGLDSAALPAELREELRRARLARGLGYKALAHRTGVDCRHLSRIERGLRMPSIAVAAILARALELEPDKWAWLMAEARSNVGRSWRPPDPWPDQ